MKEQIYFRTNAVQLLTCFFILTFCNIRIALSQIPGWEWARNATGTLEDASIAVASDASGNSYAVGYFQSSSLTFGATTLNNSGGHDVFVVKYDGSGNVLWAKSAGGSGTERTYGVDTDGSGNVYIGGYFQSSSITFGATTLNNSGGDDLFLVKYDANGNVVWAKSATGDAGDQVRALTTDGSGNVFAGGYFQSTTLNFGGASLNKVGTSNAFIVKYNTNGNVQWARSSAGKVNESEQVNSLSTDGTGNVFAGGHFSSPTAIFGSDTLFNVSSSGTNDILILKYNNNGNLLWAKREGASGNEQAQSVDADASGNLYVSGFFRSTSITFGTTTLNNAGEQDMFLTKYNASGTLQWAAGAGGSGDDMAFGVSVDGAGNSVVAGYYISPSLTFGTTTLTNNGVGVYDIFLVSYNNSGNVLAAQGIGGSSHDQAFSVDVNTSGNIWLGGTFASPSLTFGSATVTNSSNDFDTYVSKAASGCSLNITASVNPVCNGQTTIITATGASNCTISPTTGTTPLGPCSWSVKVSTTTTYTITGDKGSCEAAILVTALPLPKVSVTPSGSVCLSTNPTLTANSPTPGITYQWLKNNAGIPGATASTFTPTTVGAYKCRVKKTSTGCIKTSPPTQVANCKLSDSENKIELLVSPNPFSTHFTLNLATNSTEPAIVKILDLTGRIVKSFNNVDTSQSLHIDEDLRSGIYFLQVIQGSQSAIVKVTKSQ